MTGEGRAPAIHPSAGGRAEPHVHARRFQRFWEWFVTNFTTEALISTESTALIINFFSVPSVEISVSLASLPQFPGTRWFLCSIRLILTRMPHAVPADGYCALR